MWKKIFLQCYCKGEKNVIVENKSDCKGEENVIVENKSDCKGEENVIVENKSESGYDRLKEMYFTNEHGLISPQLYYLVHNVGSTVAITFFVGAVISMRKTKAEYVRKNVASLYESQYLANRNLTDTITLNGVKEGFRFATKYGSFSSLYMLCTMTAATYNKKITIYEHIGSGALLGALFRYNFGLRGMAVSACLGGILGTLTGGIFVSYLWYKNMSYEDMLASQTEMYYEMRRKRPAHHS